MFPPVPRCSTAVVVEGVKPWGRRVGDPGVLKGYPPGCVVDEDTWIHWVRKKRLEYAREDGFCIVYEPVKAVLPEKVCDLFDDYMAGRPRSAIFLGPGGTGKTLTLEIIKETTPFNIVEFEAEELLRPFVGQSEEALYRILREAEETEPALLLSDEVDIIIMSRSASNMQSMATGWGTAGIAHNLVRILLRRLQKWYNEKRKLGLVGASNLPANMIEKPLLREGRLGEPIYFPLPDKKALIKLAELYGKKLSEEEMEEILRNGLPHSNVVAYLKTGKLKKWAPEAFAGLEYAPAPDDLRPKLRLKESARLVIAENWAIGVKLAALISAVEFGKPVLYLKNPQALIDLDFMGRSMKFPLAIPYTMHTVEASVALYDYPHPVFYIGKEWELPYERLTLDDIISKYGKEAVLRTMCGEKEAKRRMIELATQIRRCVSGIRMVE